MKTEDKIMKFVMVSCFLYLHGIFGAQALLETTSGDRDNSSLLIQPSFLHDMLIRESQFRLTMLQNIKDLVMDAEDNKKTNQALMRNISDVTAIMQTITEKDRLIEKKNDQLRLDLNILKDAINHEDKNPRKSIHNLDLTTIPILLTEWEADYLEFNYKLKTMIEADRKIQETRNKLNDEIVTVGSKRNMTTETLERLMEMGLSLARKQTSAIQNANHELSSDNIEIKKQLAMLNDTLQNAVNKEDVDVFRIHYNERFQMFDATLMNLSLSINETVGKGLAERRNGHDEQTKGKYEMMLISIQIFSRLHCCF